MQNVRLDEAQAEIKVPGKILQLQICRWHHYYGRKWRGTKETLDESERGEWNAGLKINILKQIMASSPITSVQLLSRVRLFATPWTAICQVPVHYQCLELTQTSVHWICDAIQWSHPLLSPSPPTFNLLQHQGLFQWVSSLHQVAKVLEFQFQHQSFWWIFRTDFL